jgi:hypothetical protein
LMNIVPTNARLISSLGQTLNMGVTELNSRMNAAAGPDLTEIN